MRFERDMLLLYAVTDRAWTGKRTLDEQVEEALQGGVTLVQLREKHLSREQLIKEARRMTTLCHRYGVPLLVNDDAEDRLYELLQGNDVDIHISLGVGQGAYTLLASDLSHDYVTLNSDYRS